MKAITKGFWFIVNLFYFLSFAVAEEKNTSLETLHNTTLNGETSGKVIYSRFCAHCHGTGGKPGMEISNLLSPVPSDLSQPHYKYGNSEEEIAHTIRSGIGSNMLRFKERLSENEIIAVARYVKSLQNSSKKKRRPKSFE